MARTVDETAHGLKRDAYLDAMERLLQSKGFTAVTIADILKETGSSKGAFYHYFDSKTALLEGVQLRLLDRVAAIVDPVIAAEASALEKLANFSAVVVRWKNANRKLLLESARAWYGPDNALPRERMRGLGRDWLAGQLAQVIRQGNAEGVFDSPRPDVDARLAVVTLQDLQETLVGWIIGRHPDAAERAAIHDTIDGYHHALERLLGAAPGSIHIVPKGVVDDWFQD
ncbi:TetR/AcrR family transcriptional regulator [Stackebrandtia nassauensis]|uniref:Transcriptional regulator, TetR family n=1 Tax=Stackebrandtia nassauensis (strain DSM 44728 / CIP 108903 / NRRL B-16338 / NBRC 102104 / LLR-40K-21) TaxID=446470 RepID=D3QB49_STANL|nr:TetR/AcrR family transcriptional regulator [Stackebrandtia nassauensis]ADD40866.1 transcriptional regulator, TetR family [Stackebrandtia nassauensis DSM 44728]